MTQLSLRLEYQQNPVADEVSAITAVVRPILRGILFALKQDVVNQVGGHDSILLSLLPRLYRRGDGDCGICYEYAVHDAMNRGESSVLERVDEALRKHCRVPGEKASSILFGAEKHGAVQVIDSAKDRLTDDSVLRYGTKGRPVKLKRHIDSVATAFRKPKARAALPYSIGGLWKADLFLGFTDRDTWVGTSVKINPDRLEGARGLRVGIVPSREGQRDAVRKDTKRNLVICPLPWDGSFMQVFYMAWEVTQQFLKADANLPKESDLHRPASRQVARFLEERREFAVLDVIDALEPLSQPHLLSTAERTADVVMRRQVDSTTGAIIAPLPSGT